jgi:hypothetical protein
MAFDEARSGGGRGSTRTARGRPSTGAAGGGASAFDTAASASSTAPAPAAGYSYQNGGDSAYLAFREGVERDLRKLTSMVAATRTQVEKLGGKGDSSDLRKRM